MWGVVIRVRRGDIRGLAPSTATAARHDVSGLTVPTCSSAMNGMLPSFLGIAPETKQRLPQGQQQARHQQVSRDLVSFRSGHTATTR